MNTATIFSSKGGLDGASKKEEHEKSKKKTFNIWLIKGGNLSVLNESKKDIFHFSQDIFSFVTTSLLQQEILRV